MSDDAVLAHDVNPDAPIVETGTDGLPTDKKLRRMALSMLSMCLPNSFTRRESLLSGFINEKPRDRDSNGELVPSYLERKRNAESVLEALIASGRLNDGGHGSIKAEPNPNRLKATTPEERQANYLALAEGVGDRVGTTPEMKRKVTEFFLRIRNVYGLRRVAFGEGRAMLVPCAVRVDASGITVTGGLVVAVLPRGLKSLKAKDNAIRIGFSPSGDLEIEVDPKRCTRWSDPKLSIQSMSVSPWAAQQGVADYEIAKIAKGVLDSLKGQREGVSAYLGENLTKEQWLSLLASLRKAGDIRRHVRTTLFSILDKDVRAACLRNLGATYSFHDWLCGTDDVTRERRLQASVAYPILTPILPNFEHVIDAGEPLAPVLGETFCATPAAIRHLVGQNWQVIRSYDTRDPNGAAFRSLLKYLSVLVPEDHPQKREEWTAASGVATHLAVQFGFPLPDKVAHAVRRLDSASRLVNMHIGDALNDFVSSLGMAMSGYWDDQWAYEVNGDVDFEACDEDGMGYCFPKGRPSKRAVIARAVASLIAGENGSVKRLAAFNNDWHRGVARRRASANRLRRLSMGDRKKTWEPMTPEPFVHAKGSLRWLCDEDELAIEGEEMRHCVGTYDLMCHQYNHHIASIRVNDGTRSTAEFVIEDKRVRCIQHYSYGDSAPPDGCVAVVDAFLKMANRKKSPIDFKAINDALLARNEQVMERRRKGREDYAMSPEVAESLVRLYDECLPKSVRGLTVKDWRGVVEGLSIPDEQGESELNSVSTDRGMEFAVARAA